MLWSESEMFSPALQSPDLNAYVSAGSETFKRWSLAGRSKVMEAFEDYTGPTLFAS